MPQFPKPSSNGHGAAYAADLPLPGGKRFQLPNATNAPDLAHDPNLIDTIQRDIAALGIVGEDLTTLLFYLTGSSREQNHPLRLIIRGPSGAGKSYPLMTVVSMFPPEAVIEATSLTPQSLYYVEPGGLEHKFLVKGERSHRSDEEQADMTAALRQLISEDRITKSVTIKMETKRIEQRGPIAFAETTTSNSIFAEDLNRCLQVYADDSQEQTKRIILAAAEGYLDSAASDETDRNAILDRHREFQRSLKYVDVRIPYAHKLASHLPTEKLEARRAIKQVLATIEVIALLHQHQRGRDAHDRLIATPSDYAIARRLLLGPLNESLGCGDRAWKAYRALKQNFSLGAFDGKQTLDAKCFNNKMTRDRALKELEALDVLRCIAPGKSHAPAQWEWTGKTLGPVLPEPKALFGNS